jgi:hypothetical protein
MPDLFGHDSCHGLARSAEISACGLYRYRLTRVWDATLRPACFVMLNPSTADALQDDPTIRRCVGFARAWGCGGIVVVNLFAWRATDPRELWMAADAEGPDNDRHITEAVIECHPVIAAWGVGGRMGFRDQDVLRLIQSAGRPWPLCLGRTKGGHPRHPLYVPADTMPVPFEPRAI